MTSLATGTSDILQYAAKAAAYDERIAFYQPRLRMNIYGALPQKRIFKC